MKNISRITICMLLLLILQTGSTYAVSDSGSTNSNRIIGMYIHQHWPYNHPYAARTWTLSDWRGYTDGLKKLGYNTLLIWPMLETMPNPLTPSDRANITKIQKVINMAHNEFGMKVHIIICPNVMADNAIASQSSFEKRHFFYCDTRVNPGDPIAMKQMMEWRRKLIQPLSNADGFVIIDSDPGGYPGSNNQEFVNLLGDHRKLFDSLRPGIELTYWMHMGWPGYCRFYETGNLSISTPEEFQDALTRLRTLNPEPWGLANGLRYAEKLGLESRVVSYNYGAIEGEPSFPTTNFGGMSAYNAGRDNAPKGVIGNAQTHCVQLPNTFAFARGAQGLSITDADYVQFANDLIPGNGENIVNGWKALAGSNSSSMRSIADKLDVLSHTRLKTGPLRGLLFGSPKRFLMDIVMQLRMKAAYTDFVDDARNNSDVKDSFRAFVSAADTWQHQHGYECAWGWPGMYESLYSLQSPQINAVLDTKIEGNTPFEQVHDSLRKMETFTSRLITAMKSALPEISNRDYPEEKTVISTEYDILSLKGTNWSGDQFMQGGQDNGMSGDRSALTVSSSSAEGFPPTASMTVKLSNDYSRESTVVFNIGYRKNPLQANEGIVYWDDKQIAVCHPKSTSEGLDLMAVTVDPSRFNFASGAHELKITAKDSKDSPGYFEVDSIKIEKIVK